MWILYNFGIECWDSNKSAGRSLRALSTGQMLFIKIGYVCTWALVGILISLSWALSLSLHQTRPNHWTNPSLCHVSAQTWQNSTHPSPYKSSPLNFLIPSAFFSAWNILHLFCDPNLCAQNECWLCDPKLGAQNNNLRMYSGQINIKMTLECGGATHPWWTLP